MNLVKYPAYSVHLIFEYMNCNEIFAALQSFLLGRSLIFVADNPMVLTDIVSGFQQLIHPLYS